MFTFLSGIALLFIGYFVYGKLVERIFTVDEHRATPAYAYGDGVDYVPMSLPKNALIHLLNIAGTGPVFGPILGALYGPVAFLWIVVGAILAGAVHDYLIGMISLRNRGAHLPELAGRFLGGRMKHVVNGFSILLLLLLGTVFVTTPAALIHILADGSIPLLVIIGAIFVYYAVATILPIDVIIGRFYPLFGALLLINVLGIGIMLFVKGAPIPEFSLANFHPDQIPILPGLVFTISCGALSGFHATQSPIISRTTQNERHGRKIFFGMMIVEAVIAMVWAAAAMSLFDDVGGLQAALHAGGPGYVVSQVSVMTLGAVGGTLAVLGVIVLPITSGDTAFRSARMIIADYLNIPQGELRRRLWIAAPLFSASVLLTQIDFDVLWRYFNWANQCIAVIAFFVAARYLQTAGKNVTIALVPGTIMLVLVVTYILNSPLGFGLPEQISWIGGVVFASVIASRFVRVADQARPFQRGAQI